MLWPASAFSSFFFFFVLKPLKSARFGISPPELICFCFVLFSILIRIPCCTPRHQRLPQKASAESTRLFLIPVLRDSSTWDFYFKHGLVPHSIRVGVLYKRSATVSALNEINRNSHEQRRLLLNLANYATLKSKIDG